MVLHAGKKGLRALGVAESFRPSAKESTLAGVVMRGDFVVDGFVFGGATVGGEDANQAILAMLKRLSREDVNLIILSGCILSRYNIVDIDLLFQESGIPVLCLTYNESSGIEAAIRAHFDHPEGRLESYRRLGARTSVTLNTGKTVFVRTAGLDQKTAQRVLDSFTVQGAVPEPVRLATLAARAGSKLSSSRRPARRTSARRPSRA